MLGGANILSVGSLLSGITPGINWLIASRALLAIGGGAIMANAFTIVDDLYPITLDYAFCAILVDMKPAPSTPHETPDDLKHSLQSATDAAKAWRDITPLARNEFICWVISAKQPSTRARRIDRTIEELLEGKRRPCCWGGCPHREKSSRDFASKK